MSLRSVHIRCALRGIKDLAHLPVGFRERSAPANVGTASQGMTSRLKASHAPARLFPEFVGLRSTSI